MERFAIKIDTTLKSNLYNICRLCGIDHPKKVSIIDALTLLGIHEPNEDEPDLCKKIFVCVGIKVTKNDQMPQTVCQLCADKISDFFEYREMCSATNKQTRKLLGIPEAVQKPTITNMTGKKRKKNLLDPKIEDEGESILGITSTELDDKKDIITNIPVKAPKSKLGKASGSGIQKSKGRPSKIRQPVILLEPIKEEEKEIKNELDENYDYSPVGTLKIKLPKSKKAKTSLDPSLPLLTPKEPNKRERKRDIEIEKLQQKRDKKLEKKRKKNPLELSGELDPLSKKLKVELKAEMISCSICNLEIADTFYNDHLLATHRPVINEFGCPSCQEIFKTLAEEKDHHLWHRLSNTMYMCLTCNTKYDKKQSFSRHRTLCQPNNTGHVQNYPCRICGKEFLTQNLHDWHSCYMKNNGQCVQCLRRFVKKSTLFKHSFKCTAIRPMTILPEPVIDDPTLPLIDNANFVDGPIMSKKRTCKSKVPTIENLVKSEPEANIDDHVDNLSGNLLAKKVQDICTEARIHLTPLTQSEIQTLGNKSNDVIESISNVELPLDNHANDMPEMYDTHENVDEDDAHSLPDMGGVDNRDSSDSSDESDRDAENTTNIQLVSNSSTLLNQNNVGVASVAGPIIKTEPLDDSDDVIFVEDVQQNPIVISSELSSPPKKKDKKSKHKQRKDKRPLLDSNAFTALGVCIKEEPVDDETGFASPLLDPNVRVKEEPLDSCQEDISQVHGLNAQQTSKRKEKKTKHKNKKDKRSTEVENPFAMIRIKQEPIDSNDQDVNTTSNPLLTSITTTVPVISSVTAMATIPIQQPVTSPPIATQDISTPLSIAVKKEPVRPGYDEYDPNVALNIKQEITDESSRSPKQPSLRLKITKNRGTLNATIIENQSASSTSTSTPSPSSLMPTGQLEVHPQKSVINPLAAVASTSASSSSTSSLSSKVHKPKSKSLYKKPALLAQKIREEMLARIAREKAAGNLSKSSSSLPSPTIVPVISQVSAADGTNIPIASDTPKLQNVDDIVQIKIEKPDYDDDEQNDEDENEDDDSNVDMVVGTAVTGNQVADIDQDCNSSISEKTIQEPDPVSDAIAPSSSKIGVKAAETLSSRSDLESVNLNSIKSSENNESYKEPKNVTLNNSEINENNEHPSEKSSVNLDGQSDTNNEIEKPSLTEEIKKNDTTSDLDDATDRDDNSNSNTDDDKHLTADQESEISKVLSSSIDESERQNHHSQEDALRNELNTLAESLSNQAEQDINAQTMNHFTQRQFTDDTLNTTDFTSITPINYGQQEFHDFQFNQREHERPSSDLNQFMYPTHHQQTIQPNHLVESNNLHTSGGNNFDSTNNPMPNSSMINGLDELLRTTETHAGLDAIDDSKTMDNCADLLSSFPLDDLSDSNDDDKCDKKNLYSNDTANSYEPATSATTVNNQHGSYRQQTDNCAMIDNLLNDITQQHDGNRSVLDKFANDVLDDISDDSLPEDDDKQVDWELENKLLEEPTGGNDQTSIS